MAPKTSIATLDPPGLEIRRPIAFYYASDHLGSPRAITRPIDNVFGAWRWDDVDPFGANLPNGEPAQG